MSNYYGYAGEILRINLSDASYKTEPTDMKEAKQYIGGRGFNSYKIYKEIPAGTNPLGLDNKLMISTGPIVGTMFPTASRFNVSARSPLTGIFGDTNAGGHFAPEMKFAGYDQIILEGKAEHPSYIHINDEDIKIRNADMIWGKTVFDADAGIRKQVKDPQIQTLLCGPAAEKGVKYAGLFANQVRSASRTGMGTVMASKNLKGIAIKGTGSITVHDPPRFEKLVLALEKEIRNHEQYKGRRLMGTTRILMMADKEGFLPTRNYTQGTYEHASEVSGEKLAEEYNVKSRGCFACTIPCSRIYTVRKGQLKGLHGEGPEYESLGSLSSRIGNRDIELALAANDLCNQMGIDILSTIGAIGWAMELYEAGMLTLEETGGLELNWGNMESVMTLIHQIAYREGFGDILADGAFKAAEKLGKGHDRVMHVKGMDLIMADPRGLKGFGLGYAVASRGGDHLRSEPFIELSNDPAIGQKMFGVSGATMRTSDTGKGKLITYFEDWCAIIDAMEPCKNIMQNMMLLEPPRVAEALEVTTGLKYDTSEVRDVGARITTLERMFGVREGMNKSHDTLPSRFTETPLVMGGSKGHVMNLDLMLDEYYTERGWNLNTGHPTTEALEILGLDWVIPDLP